MVPPDRCFLDVAEHLCTSLRFSCTDGRDTGMFATRVMPVSPVTVPAWALKCCLDQACARRLGYRPIARAAACRWTPVAHYVADRAAQKPSPENAGYIVGRNSPSVTEIVRRRSRAHDLLRPLINRGGGGKSFPPLRIQSSSLLLLLALQRTEHRAPRPPPPHRTAHADEPPESNAAHARIDALLPAAAVRR